MVRATRLGVTDQRPQRVRIGGIKVDRVVLPSVIEQIGRAVEDRSPIQIVTANLQFVNISLRNRAFAEMARDADLVVADGMPLIWLSKLAGTAIPQRITGHDLVHGCAALAAKRGYSVSFLGAGPGVAESAAQRLCAMHPGLTVAGTFKGTFTESGYARTVEEEREVVAEIRRARPDFLFVALGCPKQDFWIANHLHEIEVPVCIGVGGVPDVLSGRLGRPPAWIQSAGLEWTFRLFQEPSRLWKRYLLGDIPNLVTLGAETLLNRLRRNAS